MKSTKKIISILLKIIVVTASLLGVYKSVYNIQGDFMGGTRSLLYFTIQSNLWMTAVCGVGLVRMLRGKTVTRTMMLLKFMFTVSITLTGIVFCVMLAPLLGAKAWTLNSVLCHAVVPLASIIDFLLVGGEIEYKKADVFVVALPPLYYTLFAAAGYISNWDFGGGKNYPYFFFNWGSPAGAFGFSTELPFLGVAWWLLLLLIFLIICGQIYIGIVKGKKKK